MIFFCKVGIYTNWFRTAIASQIKSQYLVVDVGGLSLEDIIKSLPLAFNHIKVEPISWELVSLALKQLLTSSESLDVTLPFLGEIRDVKPLLRLRTYGGLLFDLLKFEDEFNNFRGR